MSLPSEEQWRDVPGYEGLYEVSSRGRVRSRRRRGAPGGLIREGVDRGYRYVKLHRGNRQTTVKLHQLVAWAFVGPQPDGMEVRHLDGDSLNCAAENLAYGTRSQNRRDRIRHGTDHNVAKTHCPQGHPYDDENTYVLPSRPNARYCRACSRKRGLARYHTRRAA